MAYSISSPTNSILFLKGSNFVAIGLNRHTGGGQDDPAQDATILKGLATRTAAALP